MLCRGKAREIRADLGDEHCRSTSAVRRATPGMGCRSPMASCSATKCASSSASSRRMDGRGARAYREDVVNPQPTDDGLGEGHSLGPQFPRGRLGQSLCVRLALEQSLQDLPRRKAAHLLERAPRAKVGLLREVYGALLGREQPPQIEVERTLVAQEEGVEVQQSSLTLAR
jgi:hypothetical protein